MIVGSLIGGGLLMLVLMALAFFGLIVIVAIVWMYNSLVSLNERIDNAWAQIDVQLKRRTDLIPNLVETVKGYAKHEKSVFENVTKARTAIMKAGTISEKAKANNALTGALKSLFAVVENYPQLKANENFKLLQEELSGTESKIAYARQFYNDEVMLFNARIQKIPWTIMANALKYKQRDYFKTEEKERKAVKVAF
ncbi:MAG: LemA family protein [Candidatus Diapherotrites archaeon]|nr:LemA family protein [Candidatus Diapherotrites archaeon]